MQLVMYVRLTVINVQRYQSDVRKYDLLNNLQK